MGIRHMLLLLIYLDPLSVLSTATGIKKTKQASRKAPKATAVPTLVPQKTASNHDTCLGYYDVSGQYDKLFECNNTNHRYCCGTCYLRFCCEYKKDRLDQKACKNYQTPEWVQTAAPSPIPTGETYDQSMDQTSTAVYITCGIIAFIIVVAVSIKVVYDKATEPPQEMNIHRALADILRQQGPIPISQYDCENFAEMNGSPKDNTPVRTSSKNHYTPVHTSKSNHGVHYGKESIRSSGGADLQNFISSGFVTLGRGHQKGTHQHNYDHVAFGSPSLRNENDRISGILTSQTEPYDLSFSRSFQSLSHLPPSYEAAVKADLNRFSSLKKLTDKDVDDYYTRKRHLPDLAARGTLPLHVLKIGQDQLWEQKLQSQPAQSSISQVAPLSQSSQQQSQQRQRPRRVQRAMSQDRVLSPQRAPQQDYSMSSNGMSQYGGRILSDEQLLSAERQRSQERLLPQDRHNSQDRLYSKDRIYSKDRLILQDHLHAKDRHCSQDRLYSQDCLLSQDPLLSPDKLMMPLKRGMVSSISGGFRGSDKSISRAISHTDVFVPTTPLMDRYKITKMHSHPSASNNGGSCGPLEAGSTGHSNTLVMNQTATKRQAFASRRTHTMEQLHYVAPQHQQQQHPQHYRTGSKTEVTV
ncbi:protein shisa-6-like isoform X3 [Pungitius pungitius]|uniref:protein shisa-6-like isoform X3 n=1 Tax=Pungitius pungitius TaxID=134920 RepID=UPI002E160540